MNKLYQISEVKLSYKAKVKKPNRVKIISSIDAYKLMLESWDLEQIEHRETFKVLLLNQAYHVLGIYVVGQGGISTVTIDIRLIIQAAILANSSAMILVHNHPSENLIPSKDDIMVTKQVCNAAKLMNISVHDHIIICSDGYYSFADEGTLP